jgi:PKD repeat protein
MALNWKFLNSFVRDGTNSTDRNPMHIYAAAGNYIVNLTVSNNAGNNTITKTNYIRAGIVS